MTPHEQRVLRIIEQAISDRTPIEAVYQGHRRLLCPHVVGTKNGVWQTLSYQFGGTSSSGPVYPGSRGNWRCMRLQDLELVAPTEGIWHTADNHSQEQTCVDHVYAEVAY